MRPRCPLLTIAHLVEKIIVDFHFSNSVARRLPLGMLVQVLLNLAA